ncbi:MetQ/NlpA family ABC transporter substrate-binding protein [Lysinibacter cavernae]|uniref:D-methionine transport system substrate-binding protein n=1 Tax=Lysinibacter cavernae TaxID=1640652 RepID=A0A7X5R425_9MICO|nr:MetQ/NlpA family ABC transporter substrate-binding protein [Lysinibacter cavernae]NIH54935.1 D-methionine transport system substrate-binding protein [Lysinibacter cavernae]
MKKRLIAVSAALALMLTACSPASGDGKDSNESAPIRVGFGVGLYEQMFRDGILPILEEEGYKVDMQSFSQNLQLNPAMKEGSLDLTVFQNTSYMDSVGKELDSDMSKLNFIPSAPQGVYSDKHKSLDDVKDGSSVTVPQDPATLHRAMSLLESIDWVTLREGAEVSTFSLNDIEENPYNLDFKPLDLAQAITSLPDVDFAVINGNYITTSGRLISSALAVEKVLSDDTQLITSVMTADLDKDWAKAVADAYNSQAFKDYVLGEPVYEGWVMPPNWK